MGIGRRAAAAALLWGAGIAVNRSLRRIEGDSMRPTLGDGELVLTVPVSRLRLRRGHVVVARQDGHDVTKRVVGLPGERIGLSEGHLHVDGAWCPEPYVASRPDTDHRWHPGPEQVVLLGDNRAASTDARHHGPTPIHDLQAVVLARVAPFRWLASPQLPTDPSGRPRPSARLIVFDPDGRVLLFRVQNLDDPTQTFWETPGGGLKDRETLLEAAHRELREEVGVADRDIVDLQMTTERDVTVDGAPLRKIQHFLTCRVDETEVDRSGWTATEQAEIAEVRWWQLDDLKATGDVLITPELPDLVDKALAVLAGLPPGVGTAASS